MDSLKVLPLAITMMAGPQILTAVMLITTKQPIKSSLSFVLSVAVAAAFGTFILLTVFELAGIAAMTDEKGSPWAAVLQTILIALLLGLSLKTFLGRAESATPKWMESMREADPRKAFSFGLTLILLMPSDLVMMATVAVNLASHNASLIDALPFIAATATVSALPLLFYITFRKRMTAAMPAIRRSLNEYSWLVQVVVYLLFVYLIWT